MGFASLYPSYALADLPVVLNVQHPCPINMGVANTLSAAKLTPGCGDNAAGAFF